MARHKVPAVLYDKETNQTVIDFSEQASDIAANDLLMVHIALDTNTEMGTCTDNLSTAWTRISGGGANAGSHTVFYKIAVGGETDITFDRNEDGIVLFSIIEGANTTTPIDVSSGAGSSAALIHETQDVTTTENNVYVIKSLGLDGNRTPYYTKKGVRHFEGVGNLVTTVSISVVATTVYTAGLESEGQWFLALLDGGAAITLGIRDANPSSPTLAPESRKVPLSQLEIGNFAQPGGKLADPVFRALEADQTFDASTVDTVNGNISITGHGYAEAQIVRYQADGGTPPTGLTDNTEYHVNYIDDNTIRLRAYDGNRFDTNTDIIFGAVGSGTQRFEDVGVYEDFGDDDEVDFERNVMYTKNLGVSERVFASTQDFSGKRLGFYLDANGRTEFKFTQEQGLGVLLMDSLNNYRAWLIGGNDLAYGNIGDYLFYVVDVDNITHAYKTEGSFDSTDVTSVMFFCRTRVNSNSPEIRVEQNELGFSESHVLVGGDSSNPLTISTLAKCSSGRGINQIQGANQNFVIDLFYVGDGSTNTYFEDFSGAEFYPAYNLSDLTTRLAINEVGVEVNLGNASDAFIFKYALSSATAFAFRINALSNASATYNFDGTSFIKCNDFVLQSFISSASCQLVECTNIDLNSATLTSYTFDNCEKIEQDGSTISSSTFQNSTGIALHLTDDSSISSCTFKDNVSGLEISTAGDYTFDKFTFSGNTQDVNVTATTGTVNINVIEGDNPTFITAGATVNVTQNVAVTLASAIDGTRVQLYNVTKDIEVDNSLVSGGSGYIFNIDLLTSATEVGDTLRLRAAQQSGATAKAEIEATGILTLSGISFLDTQVDNDSYNTYAVDGSTVAEFSFDGANIEVDINDADNTTQIQRFGAWYTYYITTSDGIANLFGCVDWESINSILIDTDMCDLSLDNLKASPLLLTGGRLYRKDGATIISATSNSIQVDYDPVYSTNANDIWEVDIVNGTFPGGSAASIIKNTPRIIARKSDL